MFWILTVVLKRILTVISRWKCHLTCKTKKNKWLKRSFNSIKSPLHRDILAEAVRWWYLWSYRTYGTITMMKIWCVRNSDKCQTNIECKARQTSNRTTKWREGRNSNVDLFLQTFHTQRDNKSLSTKNINALII